MGLFSLNFKKKNNSSRDRHEKINVMGWMRRNSIRMHEDMVKKTLKHFNFNEGDYQIVANGYGDYDILIQHNTIHYKIQIDEEQMCYNLLKLNLVNNVKHKEYYHYVDSFYGDDLIYDTLKYLTNKSINN